jgi:hypothetical protein
VSQPRYKLGISVTQSRNAGHLAWFILCGVLYFAARGNVLPVQQCAVEFQILILGVYLFFVNAYRDETACLMIMNGEIEIIARKRLLVIKIVALYLWEKI